MSTSAQLIADALVLLQMALSGSPFGALLFALVSAASQLVTPEEELAFLNKLFSWMSSFPSHEAPFSTDEAREQQAKITDAINGMVKEVTKARSATAKSP